MKFWSISLLLVFSVGGKTGQINAIKSEAEKAYKKGDYQIAIKKYEYLVDSLDQHDDEILLNLANSYFEEKDTTHALAYYKQITQSPSPLIRSLTHQQLGVIEDQVGNLESALEHFKTSLKANASNEDSRYNYEIVKRKLKEKKEQKKDNKKDEQQKKQDKQKDKKDGQQKKKDSQQGKKDEQQKKKDSQQGKKDEQQKKKDNQQEKKGEQQGKKGDKKEKKDPQQGKQNKQQKEKDTPSPSVADKLNEMDISQEKAQMILEAMRNQEIQYLQQKKRKATKPRNRNRPDW